jgi:hypothetical protein
MRQKQDLLMKDAETFESYLNSIKSDEVAIRMIIQKVTTVAFKHLTSHRSKKHITLLETNCPKQQLNTKRQSK